MLGHIDSGKSSTLGQLALNCGAIDRRALERFEKERPLRVTRYNFFLNQLEYEKNRGMTMEILPIKLGELPTKNIILIDAPGLSF